MGTIVMQLVCDTCGKVLLEKPGEKLEDERFPITGEESQMIDKDHRGHEMHIDAVEKLQ